MHIGDNQHDGLMDNKAKHGVNHTIDLVREDDYHDGYKLNNFLGSPHKRSGSQLDDRASPYSARKNSSSLLLKT
jgi:hypothetical protein